jgi:membrane-bound serine protease (ClpP class)
MAGTLLRVPHKCIGSPCKAASDWRTQLLAVLTDPNVAYILLLIGVYGLIFEGSHRGIFAPGAIGSIGMVLGLAALNSRP